MSPISLTARQQKLLLSAVKNGAAFNATSIDFDAVATELDMKRKSAVDSMKKVTDKIKASGASVKLSEAEEKLLSSALKNSGDFNTRSIDFDAVAAELKVKRKSAVDSLKKVLDKIKASTSGADKTSADANPTAKKSGTKRKIDVVSEPGPQVGTGNKKARNVKALKPSSDADADEDDETSGQIKDE